MHPEDDYFPDSEDRNLYAQSQMERPPDDTAAVNELLSLGRYVVVADRALYCRHTDAILPGRHRTLIGDFEHYHEAEECQKAEQGGLSDMDCDLLILSPQRSPSPPSPPLSDDDIPF